MSIKIVYENKAVGVQGNVISTANDKKDFVSIEQIDEEELDIKNYAALEKDEWLLTNDFLILPDDLTNVSIGYWSKQLSNDEKNFETPIQIIRTYNDQYTSPAITITFDTYNDTYATNVNVKWYRNDELLYDKDYEITSSTYSCEQNVIAYNKVVITFTKMNKANRYLKIFKIDDGIVRNFYKDEIIGLTIKESVSDTGNELKINTLNLELLSKKSIKIIFQRIQALKVYNDDKLYGAFYVDSSERELNKYKIEAYDLIGMLENQTFYGDIYTNKNANELISEICKDLPYELDESLQDISLTGYIPITTSREALMQVAFVLNAMVDTSRKDTIKIFPIPEFNNEVIVIDNTRAGIDITEEISSPVSKIELITHKYVKTSNEEELYNDTLNGTIIITLSEAHYDYTISGGTIISSGANYVEITGTGGTVVLNSKTYEDQQVQYNSYNPLNTANTLPNVKHFEEATLVNQSNVTSVIEKLEKVLYTNATLDVNFLMNNEKAGDYITIDTSDGVKTGQILEMSYELSNNNIIYANVKMREVTSE